MLIRGLTLLLLLVPLLAGVRAASADDRSQVVGVWSLVSVMYEDQATKALTPVFGQKPNGHQIATADVVGARHRRRKIAAEDRS